MESKIKQYVQEKQIFDISFYQNYLKDLYININTNRSFEDLYGYLDRTSGYLCKALLKKTIDDKMFVLPISWLFSLSTHLDIDVQKAFIKKYPSVCPYCLEQQCICIRTEKMPQHHISIPRMQEIMDSKYETIVNTVEAYTFDVAVKNIMDIFTVNETIWRFSGPWHHIAKIHEEIAEIHEAYGSYRNKEKLLENIAEEIADVLAWVLGAWGISNPKKSLDDLFVGYYYKDCPLCHSFPCECKPYDSRLDSIIDVKVLKQIRSSLSEVQRNIESFEELSELIKSYDLVLQTQHGPSARLVLNQTAALLAGLENKFVLDTQNSLRIKSVIDNVNVLLRLDSNVNSIENKGKLNAPKKYDVFLSYSTIDKDEARKIEAFLSSKNYKVFLSEKSIKPGEEWKEQIRDAIGDSRLLCLLATPNSLRSEWVIREQGAAWVLRTRILPVLFQSPAKDLPDILKDYQSINLHEMEKIVDVLNGI